MRIAQILLFMLLFLTFLLGREDEMGGLNFAMAKEIYKLQGKLAYDPPSGGKFNFATIFDLPEEKQVDAWKKFEKKYGLPTDPSRKKENRKKTAREIKEMKMEFGALFEVRDICRGKKIRDPKYAEYVRTPKEMSVEYKRRLKEGLERYAIYCDEGNVLSCLQCAGNYNEGIFIDVNYSKARKYFNKACQLKSGMGCAYVAVMYYDGKGIKKNKKKAKYYLEKSCQYRFENGCAALRMLFRKPIILMKNYHLDVSRF